MSRDVIAWTPHLLATMEAVRRGHASRRDTSRSSCGDGACAAALAARIARWPRERAAHRVQHGLDVLAAMPGEAALHALLQLGSDGVTASLRKGATSRARIVAARRGSPVASGPSAATGLEDEGAN